MMLKPLQFVLCIFLSCFCGHNQSQQDDRVIKDIMAKDKFKKLGGSFKPHICFFRFEDYYVDLSNSRVSDNDLKMLGDLSGFSALDLADTKITDKGFSNIFKFRNEICFLSLAGTKVTGKSLSLLNKFPFLSELDLSRIKITNHDLKMISSLDCALVLSQTNIDDEGCRILCKSENLSYLDISGTKVTDEGLELLTKTPFLTSIFLDNCKITDNGVIELAKSPEIKYVYLANTMVTDKGLIALSQNKNIQHFGKIDVAGTKVTQDVVDRLRTQYPKLSIYFEKKNDLR